MGVALAEEANRPVVGRFIAVDGTRLHYIDRGSGTPVVLLHGNGAVTEDYVSSGVSTGCAAPAIVSSPSIDPASATASGRAATWGPPAAQARCCTGLCASWPRASVVVGHSWGTLMALALALDSRRTWRAWSCCRATTFQSHAHVR